MNIKFYSLLIIATLAMQLGQGQSTVEMSTTNFSAGVGPTTAQVGAVPFMKDNGNNNQFVALAGSEITNATFKFNNQQYTGLTYSNISTGLVFGAAPTTSTAFALPAVQKVDPLDIYNNLGYFDAAVGGPANNMFTVSPSFASGTGIVAVPDFFAPPPAPMVNGAVSVFTAAQVQFDRPGGPSAHNNTTRYYYGDLVITFNRFVANPTLHVAGLGGSYRYFPTSGTNIADPSQWRSTFFTTELEIDGVPLTKLSGNSFLDVSGSSIKNNAASPNGASTSTTGIGLFEELGAATGSVRLGVNTKTITIKVYLRGSNNSQFPWSTLGSNVAGSNRNPFTGDIWWVSVSASAEQLIPLPAAGLTLAGALNNSDVTLNWKTSSEINTRDFEIQRSTDGVNYSSLGLRNAVGYSMSESNYSYVDANMNVPAYFYRVKLNDIDGRYSYSNVVVIRKTGRIKGVKAFPNPTTGPVNIEFSNMEGSYTISLYNATGQAVRTQKTDIRSAVQYVPVARTGLTPGNYSLRITNNMTGEVITDKLILQ